MEKVRMGFIGCGGNARGHLKRVLTFPDVEVVALADPRPRALELATGLDPRLEAVSKFPDYREMLEKVELDAVEISTPHTLHYEQIMASLERGLHVLTEKPMVCTSEHARQVIAKAKEVGKVLMISYQRHFSPAFRFLRNYIRFGELGEIQFVSALQAQNWYLSQKDTWRQKLSLAGGGQLNDSGSHLLDIILWTTGLAAEEVSAYIEHFDVEVDINSALSLKFSNGALGNFSVVGNAPSGFWEDITFFGSKGAVYYRNGKLSYHRFGSRESFEPQGLPDASTPDRNFVDAILGRDEVQVPPECGLRVIELTEAAWRSAELGGRPVRVERGEEL
ncbi:MAG TPA: Gfo/Idh/MocA family oxidoreductase [Candidatus Latescibacteria bacterium]|nr:Gfo/Idh/MocA family oxidoreductase [Candidatus Latescibacterota bacterium]